MDIITITVIAVALALDAFTVALVTGVVLPNVGIRHTFRLSWHFGLFQGLMSVVGWATGLTVRSFIENFGHWVAFLLLTLIGMRMIIEALSKKSKPTKRDPTRGGTLIALSIATSIDALAVGLSFALINIDIWLPALIIAVVAATFTAVGIHLGHAIKNITRLGRYIEVTGGLVLILIGTKILLGKIAL